MEATRANAFPDGRTYEATKWPKDADMNCQGSRQVHHRAPPKRYHQRFSLDTITEVTLLLSVNEHIS
jgi:hypothetical protein